MPLARRTDPNRCPTCAERVSAFAAGCAGCGATLDPRRHHAEPGRGQRLGSHVASLTTGGRPQARLQGWRDSPLQAVLMGLLWLFGCSVAAVVGMAFVVALLALVR